MCKSKLLLDVFITKKDLRFLTVKGGKFQTVQTVARLVKKISDTYLIVRERNKKSEGYHFHALLDCKVEPRKSWFKKGVHMNLQKVGDKGIIKSHLYAMPLPPLNSKDIDGMAQEDPVGAAKYVVDTAINNGLVKLKKRKKKNAHLGRVLQYMKKEQELPIQYIDYMYVVSRKNREFPVEN